jgi:hypothetical protein
MVRAGRNHYGVSVSRRALLRLIEDESGFSLFDTEKLVDVLVHFIADFFPRFQAHHDKLDVLSGEEHLAKVRVRKSQSLDGSNIFSHGGASYFAIS